jgi:hypothetical protein
MLFSPRHTQQLKTTAHSKMTTIQKMMKQVEQQEKKQQEKLRQEEQQRGMIDNLNLYIPHARDDVSKEQMRENLSRFGKIKVIDFVAKLDKNNRNYNSAYVYFDSWYPTTENKQIQAQIKQYTKTQNKMQSFKLNYDGNLHWIILENTSPAPKPKEERKRTLDLKTPGTASATPTEPVTVTASVVTAPVVTAPVVTAPVKRTMTIDDYNVSMTEKEVSEWHKFGDELRAKKRLQEEAAEKRFIEQEKKFSDEADQLLTRANPEDQELQQDQDQDEDQEELQEEQEQEEQEELQEEQEQYYYQSQMTQAFYNYYYWMTMEQRDMDEITTAMDEDDAWDAYLEQIHEECDFCENTLGRDEHEEQDGITTAVDYGYVERLEHELTKVRFQLRRSYS